MSDTPDAYELSERLHDDSLEAVTQPDASYKLRVSPAIQSAQPLTVDRSMYVHSVTGLDTNDGMTVATPFKTLARAIAERARYGEIRAVLKTYLLGAGPYALPAIVPRSACAAGGRWFIIGDVTSKTVHATGTFTGDFAANTIGASAGLGADVHKFRFLRVTSGALVGCVMQVLENTDTSITVGNKKSRVALSAVLNGDGFEIFTPLTTIAYPAGNPAIQGWLGGEIPLGEPAHVFTLISFTGFARFTGCTVCVPVCHATGGLQPLLESNMSAQLADASPLGLPAKALVGAGVRASTFNSGARSYLPLMCDGNLNLSGNTQGMAWLGGRIGGVTNLSGGEVNPQPSDTMFRFDSTITVDREASLRLSGTSVHKFAVTAGSCIRAKTGGRVLALFGPVLQGGTTDPAGYGVDVTDAGQCIFSGTVPALTGGTAGKDLKTSNNGGVANSVLSAAGTAAGTAADALLGEVLCRVA